MKLNKWNNSLLLNEVKEKIGACMDDPDLKYLVDSFLTCLIVSKVMKTFTVKKKKGND